MNARDEDGYTAIMYVLDSGSAQKMLLIARLLLEHGADPNGTVVTPATPAITNNSSSGGGGGGNNATAATTTAAAATGSGGTTATATVAAMPESNDSTLLIRAVYKAKWRLVHLLLTYTGPVALKVNAVNMYGNTALHYAVYRAHTSWRRLMTLGIMLHAPFPADPLLMPRNNCGQTAWELVSSCQTQWGRTARLWLYRHHVLPKSLVCMDGVFFCLADD